MLGSVCALYQRQVEAMSDTAASARYLEVFPSWLRSLGEDAAALGEAIARYAEAGSHEAARRHLVAGLNYIFKSLDLIPDGIDDLGFMDDAFVVRIACALAVADDAGAAEGVVGRLAEDAAQVQAFLGDDYGRLEAYVKALRKGAARGRTVDDIMDDHATRAAFLQEVGAWAKTYEVPSFTRDTKTLIKLKAFLNAKLA
jgi:uncharacterized membrane protein YkvA (DUF1232 family)